MTSAQFMCIIGTIYLVPDMSKEYRTFAGIACFVVAIAMEFLS